MKLKPAITHVVSCQVSSQIGQINFEFHNKVKNIVWRQISSLVYDIRHHLLTELKESYKR